MVFLNFRAIGKIFSAKFRNFIRYLLLHSIDIYQLIQLIVSLMEENV